MLVFPLDFLPTILEPIQPQVAAIFVGTDRLVHARHEPGVVILATLVIVLVVTPTDRTLCEHGIVVGCGSDFSPVLAALVADYVCGGPGGLSVSVVVVSEPAAGLAIARADRSAAVGIADAAGRLDESKVAVNVVAA